VRNHKFFEGKLLYFFLLYIGKGFDWEGLTTREAPIIPDNHIDLTDCDPNIHPFKDLGKKRKSGSVNTSGRKKVFNMIRIELLQKLTLAKAQVPLWYISSFKKVVIGFRQKTFNNKK